jgi:hypothetical protein
MVSCHKHARPACPQLHTPIINASCDGFRTSLYTINASAQITNPNAASTAGLIHGTRDPDPRSELSYGSEALKSGPDLRLGAPAPPRNTLAGTTTHPSASSCDNKELIPCTSLTLLVRSTPPP